MKRFEIMVGVTLWKNFESPMSKQSDDSCVQKNKE